MKKYDQDITTDIVTRISLEEIYGAYLQLF